MDQIDIRARNERSGPCPNLETPRKWRGGFWFSGGNAGVPKGPMDSTADQTVHPTIRVCSSESQESELSTAQLPLDKEARVVGILNSSCIRLCVGCCSRHEHSTSPLTSRLVSDARSTRAATWLSDEDTGCGDDGSPSHAARSCPVARTEWFEARCVKASQAQIHIIAVPEMRQGFHQ